jgi:hypothetical protein
LRLTSSCDSYVRSDASTTNSSRRSHKRRLPCVRIPDKRDPELIATRGPTLVVVPLDILQLLFQLGYAIADLAAIEVEIGLACAGALLPPAARRRLPQARRDVLQPRDLHLQLRLAAVRMTMKDLHDNAGPIEHLRPGCTLKVACLARRDLVIDDHELRLRPRFRISLELRGIRLLLVGALKALAGLRLLRNCLRSDDARSAGDRREFLEPPLAEHRRAVELVALLRHGADDLVTERLHETAQLLDARGVRDVVDARDLNADEDRARHGRFSFHDRGDSTRIAQRVTAMARPQVRTSAPNPGYAPQARR